MEAFFWSGDANFTEPQRSKDKYCLDVFSLGKSLSESAKLSSKDIKGWLERETSALSAPIQSKAQKLFQEMKKELASLSDSCRMLSENSGKEIEKRNARIFSRAKALNKLARLFSERISKIKTPERIAYDSFGEFVQETQKALSVTDIDVRNWFPRISPFFILDRRKFQLVFEKSKIQLKELASFLTKEYVKTKTLEETYELIDDLHALEHSLVKLDEQKNAAKSEKSQLEKEIAETQQRIAGLKNSGSLGQLNQVNVEISSLSTEIKQNLQHLQKPFIKLQSLTLHGEGSGLTPEELAKLNQYLENPFDALATEEAGHPLLNQILQKLAKLMADGKLQLKPEKTRKAEQISGNIISKNSLAGFHQRSASLMMRRRQLSTSIDVAETEKNLLKLRGQLAELERKARIVEDRQNVLERTCVETTEKIRSHKTEIEKNIFSFMNKTVLIQ